MSTVIEKLNLSNFNITKNPQNFFNENTGGLYLQAEENIQEISQSALNSLLQNSDIYNNSSEYSEFLN